MREHSKVWKCLIMFACFLPWLAIVEISHYENIKSKSPLHSALEKRQFEVAKQLIKEGRADDYNRRTDWNETPLMLAIRNTSSSHDDRGNVVNWSEIVDMLLVSGVDINEAGWSCNTPLHEAIKSHRVSVITMLLNHGAILDRKNCNGRTPLMIAAAIGDINTLKVLLLAGANPNIQAKDGRTALELAKTEEIAALISEIHNND